MELGKNLITLAAVYLYTKHETSDYENYTAVTASTLAPGGNARRTTIDAPAHHLTRAAMHRAENKNVCPFRTNFRPVCQVALASSAIPRPIGKSHTPHAQAAK